MMKSGVQTCLETFMALITQFIVSISTSLESLNIIKLVDGTKPIQNYSLDSSTSYEIPTLSSSTVETMEIILVWRLNGCNCQ